MAGEQKVADCFRYAFKQDCDDKDTVFKFDFGKSKVIHTNNP